MPTLTSQDYTVHKQQQRTLYAKINILDFNYNPISEIQGVVLSGSINIDANSDIRRTASISLVAIDESFKVASGSKIWLDKYINIWTGIKDIVDGTVAWTNHGIFMPNNPTVQYSPTDKILSFEAVDLMAKLTGMRNGQIEGIPILISAGSNLRDTIISVLSDFTTFTRYSIDEPTYKIIPNDINIDAGGTVYDILVQLRDINPNYQIYFDVDGVFRFERIPDGTDEPTIVTDDLLSLLALDYTVNTDFESVKNYIEVYGKSHEPQYFGTVVRSTNTYTITLPTGSTTPSNGALIGFILPSVIGTGNARIMISITGTGVVLDKSLMNENGNTINFPSDVLSEYVIIKYDSTLNGFIYYGRQQSQAKISTFNLDSPFYAGADYDCGSATITAPTPPSVNYQYNVSNSDITGLSMLSGKTIYFYSPEAVINPTIKINGLVAKPFVNSDDTPAFYAGNCVAIYNGNTDTFVYQGNNKGIGKIRKVCMGGDYDVIYTDNLAYQRALYELYLATNLNDSLTINCVPIYWLDVNSLMSYTLPDESEPTLWMIQNISVDLSHEGTMSITAIKFYPAYPSWDYVAPNFEAMTTFFTYVNFGNMHFDNND